jgi:uncharacterized repeat protein (TIGR03943 family)
MRRWDGNRVRAAAVLAAWAAAFWFLWLSGRTALFLSGRTAWLVPLGAVLATVGAVGALAAARVAGPVPSGARTPIMLLILPVVIVLVMPPVTLGSFAATNRGSFSSVNSAVTPDDFEHGPLTMVHVSVAASDQENRDRIRARAGEEVTLEGFVTLEEGADPDEFLLTRFVITCCVADATVAQVRVVAAPPGVATDGAWVSVTGRIYPLRDEIVVAASEVHTIPAPDPPYLTAY